MSKITIARIFELSEAMATKSGKELANFLEFTAQLAEQALRALRNGLTFDDNFDAQVTTVEVKHNIPTILATNKTPRGVLVIRQYSIDNALDSFQWYFDNDGNTTVKATFVGSPTDAITLQVVVLF